MQPVYQRKSTSAGVITDIDTKQGIITGYFSVFNNKDSDGDVIVKGAFTKTIKENGKGGTDRIMHLWQHNPSQVLGKPDLMEDEKGLRFTTTISKTTLGNDVIKLYADGVITEHSIGFQTVDQQKKEGYNEIRTVKLWEGSTVTWGANEMARVTGVKGTEQTQEDLFKLHNTLTKALRNGQYSDDTFILLADQLMLVNKQIEQLFIELKSSTPTGVEPSEPQNDLKEISNILSNFKI